MALSHCTEPGQGTGMGTGQNMMNFYIMLCTVHITQGQRLGTGCIPIHHWDRYWDWYRVMY